MIKESIVDTLGKYVNVTNNQIYSCSDNPPEIMHLGALQNFEQPDGYYIAGNTLYVLEHFEFDSTKATRKGSETRRDNNRIEREFNSVPPTDEGVVLRNSLNVQQNSNNYIENSLKNMDSHYVKIESYLANLKSYGLVQDTVKVGFFIEDTTMLGNVYDPQGWNPVEPVILCHCKHFLDKFEAYPKLDFCICASTYSSQSFLWFIDKQSVLQYRDLEIDLTNIEILSFEPKVLGYKISIPSNNDKV